MNCQQFRVTDNERVITVYTKKKLLTEAYSMIPLC